MGVIEVKVTVKGEDQTLTQDFLVHEEGLVLSHACEELKRMVDDTLSKFKGLAEDIVVKFKYTW
jgi:hypothetical protein